MNDQRPGDLRTLLEELGTASDALDAVQVPILAARLRGIARRELGRSDPLRRSLDSEDLAQEALADLVRNLHRFRGDSWSEFLAFANAIMQRRKIDLARHHAARKRGRELQSAEESASSVAHSDPGPGTRVVEAEAIARARRLVAGLHEGLREPLQRRLDGHCFPAIAQEMGLTEATVRQRVTRAIAELRRRWKDPA